MGLKAPSGFDSSSTTTSRKANGQLPSLSHRMRSTMIASSIVSGKRSNALG
jgi:hypothetical protein